jgi:hypothetical protein
MKEMKTCQLLLQHMQQVILKKPQVQKNHTLVGSAQDPTSSKTTSPNKDESSAKKAATPTTVNSWMHHYPDRPLLHVPLSSLITADSSSYLSDHTIDVSPKYIDFGLISKPTNMSTASHTSTQSFLEKRLNITNRMSIPLRIVRFTVMVEQSPELEYSSKKRSRGYSVRDMQQEWIYGTVQTENLTKYVFHPTHKTSMLNTSLTIYMNMEERVRNGVNLQPGETLVEAISLFPLAPEKLMRVHGLRRDGPRLYRGTILMWFAPVSMDLREFKLLRR